MVQRMPRRASLLVRLVSMVAAVAALYIGVMQTAPLAAAHADSITYSSLGYPWPNAPCASSGDLGNTSGPCPGYNWGEFPCPSGDGYCTPGNLMNGYYIYDQWGYGFRNCTSYVAWKLTSLGVPASKVTGLGNGGNWADNASKNGLTWSSTPKAGTAAVVQSASSTDPGHVAFVQSYDAATNTITVTEYNYDTTGDGDTRTGTPASLGFTKFVDFGLNGVASGNGTLYFIKTKNTGSGTVEVHSATPSSSYQSGMHTTTAFSPGDADNGWFQMVGGDLYFIKTKNTGSGTVELFRASASSGYSQVNLASTTYFSPGDADNGWFQMVGTDLYFIKTKNTGSGKVELFRASASSNYKQLGLATATAFSPGDANNGWFQVQGADLVFIKTKNTGSGKVEYFRASASSSYQQVVVATATVFSPGDADNGWFSTEDVNGDGIADLVFIKTKNTGSGTVELFIADGSRNYQQVTSASTTWMSPLDANNGWFQVDSKS